MVGSFFVPDLDNESMFIERQTPYTSNCKRYEANRFALVIQSIMGHADYSTTMDIYAECSMEKQQEVFADLNGKIMIK